MNETSLTIFDNDVRWKTFEIIAYRITILQYLDGWELNGEVFPPVADLPMEGRVEELCGRHQQKVNKTTLREQL